MPETEKIQQRHYGLIEFDNSEKDVLQVWQHQSLESNVIQVERENLPHFIELLKSML